MTPRSNRTLALIAAALCVLLILACVGACECAGHALAAVRWGL